MKTIRQIADEIGVSKQAVFYRIKRPPLSNALQSLTSKIDGVLTVSFDGEILIKQAFEQNTVNQDRQPVDEKPSTVDTQVDRVVDSEIVKLLQKNIEILQAQLEVKDKQIEDLSSTLLLAQQTAAAAQALHAGMISHLSVSKNEKQFGIFSRLFWRNKDTSI